MHCILLLYTASYKSAQNAGVIGIHQCFIKNIMCCRYIERVNNAADLYLGGNYKLIYKYPSFNNIPDDNQD